VIRETDAKGRSPAAEQQRQIALQLAIHDEGQPTRPECPGKLFSLCRQYADRADLVERVDEQLNALFRRALLGRDQALHELMARQYGKPVNGFGGDCHDQSGAQGLSGPVDGGGIAG
jgi:hypothetical protein